MKISVLLPTRNRLELLRLAIESVRMQDYGDWEIIVSDNASDEGIGEYVAALSDPRIRSQRFDQLVPVTANWNAALASSTGCYIIMLGDDDVLVPGALSQIRDLVSKWEEPDAIYAQAHQYAYPNVIPGHAAPFIQTGYNAFLDGSKRPFRLEPQVAQNMARAAMGFRILYGFNMQHFVFSRSLVRRLEKKGPFFQSPYPDYYAANAIFLAAESLVATPEPVALIGISAKSFGYYYVNHNETGGVTFLHNAEVSELEPVMRKVLVPGSNMNDSWLYAMETLRRNFPEAKASVSYSRYRRLQHQVLLHGPGPNRYRRLLRNMRLWEMGLYGLAAGLYFSANIFPNSISTRIREAISHALFSRSPRFDPMRKVVPYHNILEAAQAHGG